MTEDRRLKDRWEISLTLLLLVACVAGTLALAWVGFIGSDDAEYYSAGRQLSLAFWKPLDGFGGMRTAVSIPIALSLKFFGDHEWALILPSCLYTVGTAVVSFLMLARLIRLRAAFVATMTFVSLPVVATTSTMASADVAELFWAVCAFWLAIEATRSADARQTRLMILAGACIALAFAARETAAALVIWLGFGFLFGYGLPRLKYFWSVLGFLAVLAAECAYFAVSTGDPFVRFRALAGTRSAASRMVVPPFTYDDTGNLRIHELIDPLVMMLTKHSFGALYWVLLVLAITAWFKWSRRAPATVPETVLPQIITPALILGVIWTVFAAIALVKLRIHARYYIAPTYFFLMAATVWFAGQVNKSGQPGATAFVIALLALINVAGIWFENRNPRFAERALADMTTRYIEPIHTDTATVYIASTFARWNGGKPELIVSTPPNPGALVYRVNSGIGAGNRNNFPKAELSKNSEVMESTSSPALLTGSLASYASASIFIPNAIKNKLTSNRSSAELLRVNK